MFNVQFLHVIREFELGRIIGQFPTGARILEIGGGTGYQALRLQQAGFDVVSIDLPDSIYSDKLQFPVQPYDGRNLPFATGSFDVVFSSNVLEHVFDLGQLHSECFRVLQPGGFCLHVMPSGAWRFWTNVAHYTEMCQCVALLLPRLFPRSVNQWVGPQFRPTWNEIVSTVKHYKIVPRHGEVGTAMTEIVTFSSRHWRHHFYEQGLAIDKIEPIGLFYTGHMVLGRWIPIALRRVLSHFLGSACMIYRVRVTR